MKTKEASTRAVVRIAAVARALVAPLALISLLALPGTVPSATAQSTTKVGPAHGTVVVVGGGSMGREIYDAFIEAAGGPDALIVDVPNAGGETSYGDNAAGARRLRDAGARNVHVLFTTDRAVADADSFTAVLKRAGGVWFDGGDENGAGVPRRARARRRGGWLVCRRDDTRRISRSRRAVGQ